MTKSDLYDVLGVSQSATPDEIKKAWRKRIKTAHPDHEGDVTEYRALMHACNVLSDSARRAKYDATGDTSDAHEHHTHPQARIAGVIGPVMMALLQECAQKSVDPATVNMVEQIKGNLSRMLSDGGKHLREMEKMRETAKKALGRFLRKKSKSKKKTDSTGESESLDPKSFFDGVLRAELNGIESAIKRIEDERSKISEAIAYLDDCGYEFTAQIMMMKASWGSGTSSSTW